MVTTTVGDYTWTVWLHYDDAHGEITESTKCDAIHVVIKKKKKKRLLLLRSLDLGFTLYTNQHMSDHTLSAALTAPASALHCDSVPVFV